MTDRSKQHCGHECNGEVCYSYRDYQSDDLDPCLAVKCQHDTRTHSTAQQPDPEINHMEKEGRGYRCPHCEVRNESRFCHYVGKTVAYSPQPAAKIKREECGDLVKWMESDKTYLHSLSPSDLYECIKGHLESLRGEQP